MADVFEKFVAESTKLHRDTLTEQIRMSEDINKYSVWLLSLATAGAAVLVVRFEAILQSTWIQWSHIKAGLVFVGIIFLLSILFGAIHQALSIRERNCYRVLITMFGAQALIPYFKHPDYPHDHVPQDMQRKISDGQLLNHDKISKFEHARKQAKKLGTRLSVILNLQQVMAGIGYALLFVASIPTSCA